MVCLVEVETLYKDKTHFRHIIVGIGNTPRLSMWLPFEKKVGPKFERELLSAV